MRGPCHGCRGLGVVGPQGHGDEPHLDVRGRRRSPAAADDGGDAVAQPEPALAMERGSPADLGVDGALRGHVLDQLAGASLQRLGVLQQRDGQVEGAQQLGLVTTASRSDQPLTHGRGVRGHVGDAVLPRPRELKRGGWAQRAVEVEVQLRLGHGTEPARAWVDRSGPSGTC